MSAWGQSEAALCKYLPVENGLCFAWMAVSGTRPQFPVLHTHGRVLRTVVFWRSSMPSFRVIPFRSPARCQHLVCVTRSALHHPFFIPPFSCELMPLHNSLGSSNDRGSAKRETSVSKWKHIAWPVKSTRSITFLLRFTWSWFGFNLLLCPNFFFLLHSVCNDMELSFHTLFLQSENA